MRRVVAFSWLALMLTGSSAFAGPKAADMAHKVDVKDCTTNVEPGLDRAACLQDAHDAKAASSGKSRGVGVRASGTSDCQAGYKSAVWECTQGAAGGELDLAVCLTSARETKQECMYGSPTGDTDPGDTDPGDTDPGGTDPGDTDPGDTDPGGIDQCATDCEASHAVLLQECDIAFDLGQCNLEPNCEAFMLSLRQGCYNTADDDLQLCLAGCPQ